MTFKGVLAGLAAVAVLAFGAAGASAQTISPAGQFTAGSNAFLLDTHSPIICGSAVVAGTLDASGNGATTSLTFANCKDLYIHLAPTVAANTQWQIAISSTSGGATTTFTGVSLHVVYPAALGCSYDLVGSATVSNAGSGGTTTIPSWGFGAESSVPAMAVKNVTPGCAVLNLGTNPTGRLGGTLTLATPITVTG